MSSVAATEVRPRTLVVGLGNPVLGDDGVGWKILDTLEWLLASDARVGRSVGQVEVDRLSVGGLSLMERLVGYDRAILADAVLDGGPAGRVRVTTLPELASGTAGHLDSAHDTTLSSALAMGRALGAQLPRELAVVTVSAERVSDFDETMTPAVEAAVEEAVWRIVELLRGPAKGGA